MPARPRTLVATLALVAGTCLAAGCHHVDLAKNLTVTPIVTGYYDDGVIDGQTHLVPSLTFKLKATGTEPVPAGVRLTISFWFAGDNDGENDSVLLHGLDSTLQPGDETGSMTARAPHGFSLAGARADFFQNTLFKDMVAKVFIQGGGTFYRLGEFPIDHQIIPHATSGHP